MWRVLYIAIALLAIGIYAAAEFTGRDFRQTQRGQSQQGVRGAHGGRSFWYYGYHGGK